MPEPRWIRIWWTLRLLCDVLVLVAELDSVQLARGLSWDGWAKLYVGGMKALLIIALLVIVCSFTYYDTHMELFGRDSDTDDGFVEVDGSAGRGWGSEYHNHRGRSHHQQQRSQEQNYYHQPHHGSWSEEDFLRHPKEQMSSQYGGGAESEASPSHVGRWGGYDLQRT